MRLVRGSSWIYTTCLALSFGVASACVVNATGKPGGGGEEDAGGGGGHDGGGGGNDGGGGGGNDGGGGGEMDAGPQDPDGGGGGEDGGGGGGEPNPPPWTGHDNVPPSQRPPGGLSPNQVPLFVGLGWDDNGYSGLPGSGASVEGGVHWAVETIKSYTNANGTPARATFYLTATYIGTWMSESPVLVKRSWRGAADDEMEIGNHTYAHNHGAQFSVGQWQQEIQSATDWIRKPWDPNEDVNSPNAANGIGWQEHLYGFRTPFLEYNDNTLAVVDEKGFYYDCSIEEGWQEDHDGTNYNWPYTLDHGSPGHEVLVEWGSKEPITNHPGLWELPVYPVIVPPELRDTMHSRVSWFDPASGKITGFDYNLWVSFSMTKTEFVKTLKYTLDQRLAGNRAPMLLGVHSDYYSDKYTGAPAATAAERRAAIKEFLDYARSKQAVQIVSYKHVLDWMREQAL